MREELYIIEARDNQGNLLLDDCSQPESVFGIKAIQGINIETMSKIIFAKNPNAVLTGDNIINWPKVINPNWIARKKTW